MVKKIELEIPQIEEREGNTAHENVYYRLRNALMIGALEPGTPLKIRALAEYMGISPTPIREALRRLSSENALEVLGNRRIVVPEMSAGRFDELIHLRITVECHAAERALPYITDNIVQNMTELDDQMDQSILEKQYDALTILNHEFHNLLYSANPDQIVMPIVQSIWLQLGPFQRRVIRSIDNYYRVDRHKEVLDALRKRDTVALSIAIEADIRDGIGRVGRKVLRERKE